MSILCTFLLIGVCVRLLVGADTPPQTPPPPPPPPAGDLPSVLYPEIQDDELADVLVGQGSGLFSSSWALFRMIHDEVVIEVKRRIIVRLESLNFQAQQCTVKYALSNEGQDAIRYPIDLETIASQNPKLSPAERVICDRDLDDSVWVSSYVDGLLDFAY